MAGPAFKQECPSCEAQVPIKDVSLVGKKVLCPKCKYAFVVAKPAGAAGAAAAPAAKKPAAAPIPSPAEETTPSAAAKASRKKLFLGLGLAGIGIVVLGLASFFILGKPSTAKKGPSRPPNYANLHPSDPPEEDKKDPKDGKKPDKKDKDTKVVTPTPGPELTPPTFELTNLLPGDTEHVFHGYFGELFGFASPFRPAVFNEDGTFVEDLFRSRLGFSPLAIDDLIRAERFTDPGWVFTVVHFKEVVDDKALETPLSLKKQPLVGKLTYYKTDKRNLAFEAMARIGAGVPNWLYGLVPPADRPLCVHFYDHQTVIFADEAPLKDFLTRNRRYPSQAGAVNVAASNDPNAVAGTTWEGTETRSGAKEKITFTFTETSVTMQTAEGSFDGTYTSSESQLGLKFGAIRYDGRISGTNFVGDGADPGSAKFWKFTVARTKTAPPPAVKAPEPGKDAAGPAPTGPYVTIDPSLKRLLDRIQAKPADAPSTEKVLFATATKSDAARINVLPPEHKDKTLWRPRQVWDLTYLFDERKPPRIRTIGSGLVERNARSYQHRSIFECPREDDARDLLKIAHDQFASQVARGLDRLLRHKIDVLGPGVVERKTVSRMSAVLRDDNVDVTLHLILDNATLERAKGVATMLALGARGPVDLVSEPNLKHLLGRGVRELGEKGLPDRKLAVGQMPPGAFRRPKISRASDAPYYRMSWMTSLLPYLGHDNLFRRLDPDVSWREPSNWLAARTLIPEFQDPNYPDSARFASVPGLGVDPAATHFVGIAGVGLDAAEYDPSDVSMAAKRGVLAYDKSATMDEIQKGHGAANTILMIQVPHDGLTGVSPWIAGGGSTLRGVPEKNSIAPFVLGNDKTGKPITYQGRSGTFAVMVGGNVRFIDKSVSDDVFKAMCTVQGQAPKEDFWKDIPLVPDPTEKKVSAPPPPPKVETVPPKAVEKKK
jgi:hypothetical protein